MRTRRGGRQPGCRPSAAPSWRRPNARTATNSPGQGLFLARACRGSFHKCPHASTRPGRRRTCRGTSSCSIPVSAAASRLPGPQNLEVSTKVRRGTPAHPGPTARPRLARPKARAHPAPTPTGIRAPTNASLENRLGVAVWRCGEHRGFRLGSCPGTNASRSPASPRSRLLWPWRRPRIGPKVSKLRLGGCPPGWTWPLRRRAMRVRSTVRPKATPRVCGRRRRVEGWEACARPCAQVKCAARGLPWRPRRPL